MEKYQKTFIKFQYNTKKKMERKPKGKQENNQLMEQSQLNGLRTKNEFKNLQNRKRKNKIYLSIQKTVKKREKNGREKRQ